MFLIVGLGNPGRKYEITRHNAGFLAADILAENLGARIERIKFKSLITNPIIHSGRKLIIQKPSNYMNLSGESVLEAAKFYGINPENIVVIYDDLDTSLGQYRVRGKGSGGSHNGMKNIIYHLQSDNFPRIRIGIGRNPGPMSTADYVLQRFTESELKHILPCLKAAADACLAIVEQGIDTAMNRFNIPKTKKADAEQDKKIKREI